MEDTEIKTMGELFTILDKLDKDAQIRVINWLHDRLGLGGIKSKHTAEAENPSASSTKDFDTFADLYNRAQPSSNSDKALVAGYWLQVSQGQSEFPSQSANRELQNLGYLLANITDAFNQLKNKKPALAIQVKKSGKSQQARKQYKLTQAGIDVVRAMIDSKED